MKKSYLSVIALVAILGVASVVIGYSGDAPKVVVEGNYIEAADMATEDNLGAMPGSFVNSEEFTFGDVTTVIKKGNWVNATTTIVAVPNPFSGTSTADLVQLETTGVATSTYTVACGESVDRYSTNLYSLLSSGSIATSTNPGIIENNVAATAGGEVTGGTMAKIHIGPGDWFVCKVTVVTAYDGAFLDGGNSSAGKYTVRFYK